MINLRAVNIQILRRHLILPARNTSSFMLIPIGLVYMILAVFFFSLMSLFGKVLSTSIPTGQILIVRAVVGSILAYWGIRAINVPLWGVNKKLLIFRGVTGFGALMCFFWTLISLSLAEATILFYTSPCLAALIATVILRERMSVYIILGFILCMIGVLCVIQPEFIFKAEQLDLLSVGVGLLGALLAALAFVSVRKLRETDHALVIIFYFSFISIFASVPFVIVHHVLPTPTEWLFLIGVGISTHIAQIFLTRSLHKEHTSRAMGMSYIQILFAVSWGIVFFGDYPNILSLIGMILVVAGSILTAQQKTTIDPDHPHFARSP